MEQRLRLGSVSPSVVVERYWKQYQSSGHVRARQRGGYKKSRLEGHDEPLRKWIDDEPGLTLEEILGRCADELGVTIGINALWQRLDKLGLSSHYTRKIEVN